MVSSLESRISAALLMSSSNGGSVGGDGDDGSHKNDEGEISILVNEGELQADSDAAAVVEKDEAAAKLADTEEAAAARRHRHNREVPQYCHTPERWPAAE